MKRINVVGSSGSGKSTLSKEIAKQLEAQHIEMDALYWGRNWEAPSNEVFDSKLKTALESDTWVLDGNYSRTTPVKWSDVDTVVWIDYSFKRTFFQVLFRAIRRIITKRELWPNTGNRESFKKTFLSRDSILLWMITNYHSIRRRYEMIMSDPNYAHINFVRLTSPKESEDFLKQIRR